MVSDSAGFAIAIPRGSTERSSDANLRHWELAEALQGSMTFGVIRGDLGLAGYRRFYQPELMLDYTECVEARLGYQMSIQAWRTPNGVFRDFRRADRYDVFAIWQTRPGEFVYLTGGSSRRQSQELMLAAIRRWRSLGK